MMPGHSSGGQSLFQEIEAYNRPFQLNNNLPQNYDAVTGVPDNTVDDSRSLILSPHLKLPLKAAQDVWFICGKRGSGKSYFLGKLCEELNRIGVPFIIIDVVGAHSGIQLPGTSQVHINSISTSSLINRAGGGESFVVSCRGLEIDELREKVRELCVGISKSSFARRYNRALMLAIEEAHNFVGQGSGTAGGNAEMRSQCYASIDKLVREGRQDGVGAIFVSQAVANIESNIRRQSEIKVLFKVMDTTDINTLRKSLIGTDKNEIEQIVSDIYKARVGQFVCVAPSYIKDKGMVRNERCFPRTTEHAGTSFLGDSEGLGTGLSDFLDPDPFSIDNDDSQSDMLDVTDIFESPGKEDDDDDEPVSYYSGPSGKIDIKSALSLSLLAISLIGLLGVIIKRRMDKKNAEREMELEKQFKAERRRERAVAQQQSEVVDAPAPGSIGDLVADFNNDDEHLDESPFSDLDDLDAMFGDGI